MNTAAKYATPNDQLTAKLQREWDEGLSTRLTSWSQRQPALSAMHTPADAVDALNASTDYATNDAILHALLMETASGDQLAHRTVLHAMSGTIGALARHARGVLGSQAQDAFWRPRTSDTWGEAYQMAYAALYAAIAEYPLHRTVRVAVNIKGEAMHKLFSRSDGRRCRITTRRPTCYTVGSMDDVDARSIYGATGGRQDTRWLEATVDTCADPCELVAAAASELERAQNDATTLLVWAQDHGVLSPDEIQLLSMRHLTDDWTPANKLADQLGLTPENVRQRYHRATRKLAAAVQASLAAEDAAA